MSTQAYQLTALHQKVDQAIFEEMRRAEPSSLNLLRLKKARLAIRTRLKALMSRH